MQIPTLDSGRVQVRPIGTPYDETDKSTGEAALSHGLDELGAGVDTVVEAQKKAQKEADGFRADDAYLKFGAGLNDKLHGEDGFLNKLGEQGLDVQPTLQDIEKLRQSTADGLANADQRRRFNLKAQAATQQAVERMESHSAQQRVNVYEGISTGSQKLALDTIATDPSQVDSAVGKVLVDPDGGPGPMRRYLMKMGAPAEQVQALENDFKSKAYQTAVQTYIDAKDYQNAEAAFTKYQSQLGPAAEQLKRTIGTLKNDILGEASAMKFVQGATDPANGRVDSAKAIAAIDTIPEGTLRDEARKRTLQRVQESKAAWEETVHKHFSTALTGYETAGWGGIKPDDKEWLHQNAPDEFRRLLKYAQEDADRQRRQGKEKYQETDAERNALTAVRAEIASDPDRFKDMSPDAFISQYNDSLSPSGRKVAGALYAATKKEPKGNGAEFVRFVGDEVRGNTDLKNKQTQDQFKAFMGDQRRDFVAQHKREPNLDEMEGFRSKAFEKAVQKGWFWNSETPTFQAAAKAKADAAKNAPAAPSATAPSAAAPAKPAAPKVPVMDRVRQLKGTGKSPKDIANILNAEGYSKGGQ